MIISGFCILNPRAKIFHMIQEQKKRVTVIGGGTGNFTLLKGLKNYPLEIDAIVSMADSGGSSGELRDEMGVLPPGDLRQCIVALLEESDSFRKLMNHRYGPDSGKFNGSTFGNLFISTYELEMGNLDLALEEIHKVLKLRGRVVPVTYNNVHLMARARSGQVFNGEHIIDTVMKNDFIEDVYYDHLPTANDKAVKAIFDADLVVISPGDPNTSILPNLIIPEIAVALRRSKAQVAMVTNLMTKFGHSNEYTVGSFVKRYEDAVGERFIDTVIYNTEVPSDDVLAKYVNEGGPVRFVKEEFADRPDIKLLGADLISKVVPIVSPHDKIPRSLIRHNSTRVASMLIDSL